PAPADSTVAAAARKDENAPLKDGVYYGWGTSRHGDIQASVEIKSGKIIGAYISQCLTQYSCSWVSALPGQVVQRQSAEVDYVSGATQSSNAFYYAVIDALKKAK
ncbi:MAG: FMN-binding protein, partial [Gemmatimonadales bacterium]